MSHFSTIKTQLKEAEPLIQALNILGYNINQQENFVKGYKGKNNHALGLVPAT